MEQNENFTGKIRQVTEETKTYVALQLKLLKVESIEKLSILLSTFISLALVALLAVGAVFYLLFALVYVLAPLIGMALSLTLIGGIFLLMIGIVLIFKTQLIINPLVRFLSNLFLKDDNQ